MTLALRALVRGVARLPGWLTFALSVAALWAWLRDARLVALFVGSMTLHELGHALVLWRAGVRVRLVFIPLVGAAVVPVDEAARAHADALPWRVMGRMLLAGPFANLLLALAGLGLARTVLADAPLIPLTLASLNATLGVFNLLPFWKLDGGQFMLVLFSSLDDQRDALFAVGLAAACAICLGALLWVGEISLSLGYFLIVGWGVLASSRRDDPAHHVSTQAMGGPRALKQLLLYLALFAALAWAADAAPNWVLLWRDAILGGWRLG